MKIRIDVDCTPDEARAFLGMPDVRPLQDAFVEEMRTRMDEAFAKMDPEALFKAWMPQDMPGWEEWRKMWTEAAGGAKKKS